MRPVPDPPLLQQPLPNYTLLHAAAPSAKLSHMQGSPLVTDLARGPEGRVLPATWGLLGGSKNRGGEGQRDRCPIPASASTGPRRLAPSISSRAPHPSPQPRAVQLLSRDLGPRSTRQLFKRGQRRRQEAASPPSPRPPGPGAACGLRPSPSEARPLLQRGGAGRGGSGRRARRRVAPAPARRQPRALVGGLKQPGRAGLASSSRSHSHGGRAAGAIAAQGGGAAAR